MNEKYCIYKNNELVDSFASYELAQDALKEWFVLDAESDFECGYFTVDENGVLIKSDNDGKLYTQAEIAEMDSWGGGEYVFDDDFCEYTTADREHYEILKDE